MRLKFTAAALACTLLCGCVSQARSRRTDTFPDVFKAVRGSVVLITMLVPPDGAPKSKDYVDGFGTGFVVSSGSWGSDILTDAHVIEDGRNLHVTIDETRKVAAHIVAVDKKNDLALMRTSVQIPAARLGHSQGVEAGQAVGVAGFPIPDAFVDEGLGIATSVKSGRVSSLRKDAIELDVSIIPGESGGPIFDAQTGEVIGIAESRFEEERAIGFAIPVDTARRFLTEHHAHGFPDP